MRAGAALALSELAENGVYDEMSLAHLIKLLEDEDVRVRKYAVWALRKLAEKGVKQETNAVNGISLSSADDGSENPVDAFFCDKCGSKKQ